MESKQDDEILREIDGDEEVEYGLTNDYMFRSVFQTSEEALRGLLSALLYIPEKEILSCVICNPIILGDAIDEKTCILDIRVLLNGNKQINLEIQMGSVENWTDRSVFYNEYALKNRRTGYEFTGKIALNVLDLSCLEQVPEEERNSALYYWACIFKAKTWKEILAMAEQSESIKKAVVTLRELSGDEKIRLQCEARERYQMDWQSSMRTSHEKGRKEERQEILNLMSKLAEAGRMEELKRAIEDEEYREQLINELK